MKTYLDLNETQRVLLREVEQADGDLHDYLKTTFASDEDKAAVAEVLGGPGAGAEFLDQ